MNYAKQKLYSSDAQSEYKTSAEFGIPAWLKVSFHNRIVFLIPTLL